MADGPYDEDTTAAPDTARPLARPAHETDAARPLARPAHKTDTGRPPRAVASPPPFRSVTPPTAPNPPDEERP